MKFSIEIFIFQTIGTELGKWQEMEEYQYQIDYGILQKFAEEALKNKLRDGTHIETLGIISGKRDNDVLVSTRLTIPKQVGTDSTVSDEGKFEKVYGF